LKRDLAIIFKGYRSIEKVAIFAKLALVLIKGGYLWKKLCAVFGRGSPRPRCSSEKLWSVFGSGVVPLPAGGGPENQRGFESRVSPFFLGRKLLANLRLKSVGLGGG